jgi:hypothetical protein
MPSHGFIASLSFWLVLLSKSVRKSENKSDFFARQCRDMLGIEAEEKILM